jgi:hypothetical protein
MVIEVGFSLGKPALTRRPLPVTVSGQSEGRYFANASTTSFCIRTFMAPAASIVVGGGK